MPVPVPLAQAPSPSQTPSKSSAFRLHPRPPHDPEQALLSGMGPLPPGPAQQRRDWTADQPPAEGAGAGAGADEALLSGQAVPIPDGSAESVDAFAAELIGREGVEDAFYVLDLGAVEGLFRVWKAALPRVTPFYAVKCNPAPEMLSKLDSLGAGFDCASEAEIKQVLGMGVAPDRVIFANPCKMPSHVKFAATAGVATTTFDSEAELDKVALLYPQARLVLRIQTQDGGARCPLGTKYGALPEEVEGLLSAAAQRNLNVCGVSFHIGSGARDATAYRAAIAEAREVFDIAAARGHEMWLLDIGGGFTAPRESPSSASIVAAHEPETMSFFHAAQAINDALEKFFPQNADVTVIAEPGRYFAETPSTLFARIFGKRARGGRREYWINDGIYGSMNCTLYDHAVLSARVLHKSSSHSQPRAPAITQADFFPSTGINNSSSSGKLLQSTVFGPTCDGLDVVFKNLGLPELEMGDWLVFPNMGAYTAAAGSGFNGFATSELRTRMVVSTDATTDHSAMLN